MNNYNYNNYYNSNYGGGNSYAPAVSYSDYLSGTFRWMAGGLLLTFVIAFLTAYTSLIYTVYSLYLPLTIAELVMVFVLSARIQTMQVGTARALFLGYAALNGLVLSLYFYMFDISSLIMAFLAAAIFFGVMAVYGSRTERDLSGWGRYLVAALIAMIICGIVGSFLGMGLIGSILYSGIGLGVFMFLTAYDMQKLQSFYSYYVNQGDEMLEKSAIFGALGLYLDFINIFLRVVQLFGGRRRD